MTSFNRRTFLAGIGAGSAFVGAGSALSLASAAASPALAQSGGEVVIGVSTQDLQNPYWLQLIEAFRRAAEPTGARILVGSAISGDPAGQAQDVANFLAQGAQAIAVSPVNPAALQSVFDEARARGVYVINNHFPVEFGHYDVFLDTGPYESGQLAGSYAAAQINERFGGAGKVGVLTMPENETLRIRVQGIIDTVRASAPQSEIVSEQRAADQASAESVVSNMLTANPDINTILGWSDAVVLGGVAAIGNLQRDPADFVIVGIDATDEALNAVQAGRMSATVNNPPDAFGKLAFAVAHALVTDPESNWHFIQRAITKLNLVTAENVGDFL